MFSVYHQYSIEPYNELLSFCPLALHRLLFCQYRSYVELEAATRRAPFKLFTSDLCNTNFVDLCNLIFIYILIFLLRVFV